LNFREVINRFCTKQPILCTSLVLFPFLALPLFYNLTLHPVFNWDEARQAMNMLEMAENGNPLVTYFEGAPDHYNTKPPLLIIMQTCVYLITDHLELSLRLPSALAGLICCLVLLGFCSHYLKRPLIGGLAALILVSISGFVELHGTRTGDYDALITLWILLFLIQFYLFLEKGLQKHLMLFYLFFALGIATKASVPFLTLPILLIWTLYKRKLGSILMTRYLYIGLVIPLSMMLLLYPFRELFDPGYIQSAWFNDFGGRYGTAIDGHAQPYPYYFKKLWVERALYFSALFPVFMLIGLISKPSQRKNILLFSGLFCVGFILLISQSVTKIYWYDTPIMPFLALTIAVGVSMIYTHIKSIKYSKIILIIMTLGLLVVPYLHNATKSIQAKRFSWEGPEYYEPSLLLKKAINGEVNLKRHYLLFDNDYYPHYEVYNILLGEKQGYKISYKQYMSQIGLNDKVIYFQAHRFEDSLRTCFKVYLLDSINPHIKMLKVKDLTCQRAQQTSLDKNP